MRRKNTVVGIMIYRDSFKKLSYRIEHYNNIDESIRKNSNELGLKIVNTCPKELSSINLRKETEAVINKHKKLFILNSSKLGGFLSRLDEVIKQPDLKYLDLAS